MTDNILLHLKDGNKIFSRDEFIQNAQQQERDGIKPHLSFYGKDTSDIITPAGWLVFSTWQDGAGVVYKRSDGKYILLTGWQGDFVYH